MFEHFYAYGSTTRLMNTLETEDDIKVFLSKYKQWYIKERHFNKEEAERHIKNDISYFIKKFSIKEELVQKFSRILRLQGY